MLELWVILFLATAGCIGIMGAYLHGSFGWVKGITAILALAGGSLLSQPGENGLKMAGLIFMIGGLLAASNLLRRAK